MLVIWKYRFCLILFLPSIIISTTSVFQAFLYCFILVMAGVMALLCMFLLKSIFLANPRAHFYLSLGLFFILIYIPYRIIIYKNFIDPSLIFWAYFACCLPLLALALNFESHKEPMSLYAKQFFVLIVFFCFTFLFIALLREFLSFQEIRFWTGNKGILPLGPFLKYFHLDGLKNNFFTTPLGGILITGFLGAILYSIIRKKYES